ncbi:MAG: acyltransferase [Erythrobacter sp.]|nr:acyltransferase [Erythrobacter sp.]
MKVLGGRYLTSADLRAAGLAEVGNGVLVHETAQLVDLDRISIGDNCRIDGFCVVSAAGGAIALGSHIHLATGACLFGSGGIRIADFANISGGVRVYSVSDDYSGATMSNPMVPERYKALDRQQTDIGEHAIVGSGSVVLPGATIAQGVAVGALSLVTKPTEPWTIYAGQPAKALKPRRRDLLQLADRFLAERGQNPT